MKVNKRYVTLIEFVISISLTAIILTSLTMIYQQFNLMNIAMDKAQNENFKKRYIENRLAFIFPRALPSNKSNIKFHFFSTKDASAYTKAGSDSLTYSYDNCVKLNKNITHYVIGKIFVDVNDNLILTVWPSDVRWEKDIDPPMHKEILLQGVESITFSFFVPPDKVDRDLKTAFNVPNDIKGGWVNEWEKEYRALPAIVKLEITLKELKENGESEKLTFAFPFPNAYQPIIYDQ